MFLKLSGHFLVIAIITLSQSQFSLALDVVLPASYDSSVNWKSRCLGFQVIQDQLECSSCCAMAISSALSVRECMKNHRNILFSSQQIWDCTGLKAMATCKVGVSLDSVITDFTESRVIDEVFIDSKCSNYTPREYNSSQCDASYTKCLKNNPDDVGTMVGETVSYNFRSYTGISEYGVWLAMKNMMAEIFLNGPVVATIRMSTHEFSLFSNISNTPKGDFVFVPNPINFSNPGEIILGHCLMVYGWGKDEKLGTDYWLVQNSYGREWGKNGTAKIVRGLNWLETTWRGISTRSRPCLSGKNCLNITNDSANPSNNNNIKNPWKQTTTTVKFYGDNKNDNIVILSNREIFIITFITAMIVAILIFFFVIPTYSPSLKTKKSYDWNSSGNTNYGNIGDSKPYYNISDSTLSNHFSNIQPIPGVHQIPKYIIGDVRRQQYTLY
jgi:hypothetical protein